MKLSLVNEGAGGLGREGEGREDPSGHREDQRGLHQEDLHQGLWRGRISQISFG